MRSEDAIRPASGTDELVITRLFNAPRTLLFKAWTEPDRLAEWWGPGGSTMLAMKLDLRPGGLFHYCMQAPAGDLMGGKLWGKFVYREIVPPERLVFVSGFADEQANFMRHPLGANWPLEILNTLTLDETGGKTTLLLRGEPINATEPERRTFDEAHAAVRQGFARTLDQLADHLATAR